MRVLAILGLILLASVVTLVLIPSVKVDFVTSPSSLPQYLGTPIPATAKVTHLAAMSAAASDGRSLHLQSKVEITNLDFIDLVTRLGLTRSDSAILSPGYMFDGKNSGEWWTPPELDVQLKIPDRYSKTESTANLEHRLVMIWIDGIAYIYETKFEGPITR